MRVSELGEFQLIERIAARIAGMRPPVPNSLASIRDSKAGPKLLLTIGDDAAVWRIGGLIEVATTDTLVEGVHFLDRSADPRSLGWKALAANTSDVNAMGAMPAYALVTLGLPPETEVAWIDSLYDGLTEHGIASGTSIVGGDLVRSPVLFITISATGIVSARRDWRQSVLLRSEAKPGDRIGVSNTLGGSAGGLAILLGQREAPDAEQAALLARHHRPNPPIGLGAQLVRLGVRCGMDLSDGLAGDLAQICRASQVGAMVTLESIPAHPALLSAWPAEARHIAAAGGEDYELLFTASPAVWRRIVRHGLPVTEIGQVVPGPPMVRFGDNSRILSWDHLLEQR